MQRLLRQLRTAKHLTQAELAQAAKLSRPYISMLEAGQKKNLSLPALKRLARALGVPPSALL